MATEPILTSVDLLTYDHVTRLNVPTAEYQLVLERKHDIPVPVAYARRNRDLDPQLVWRGKDEQAWSDLVVQAPPLYIQEKVHPKVLIQDLLRHSGNGKATALVGRRQRDRRRAFVERAAAAQPDFT